MFTYRETNSNVNVLCMYIEASILVSGTLFQLSDSLECGCILNNSITQKCDSNGKCACEEKYSGLKCAECASGFIGYPECKGTKKVFEYETLICLTRFSYG